MSEGFYDQRYIFKIEIKTGTLLLKQIVFRLNLFR